MAISRKSTFMVRIVAIGALALMILAVIVCIVIFLKTGSTTEPFILPDTLPSDIPPPSKGNNVLPLILFVVFLIALFVMVFIVAMREQKRDNGKDEQPARGSW